MGGASKEVCSREAQLLKPLGALPWPVTSLDCKADIIPSPVVDVSNADDSVEGLVLEPEHKGQVDTALIVVEQEAGLE
eukprot:2211491-Lingulodinium_polyedra.AAC.1